MKAKIWVGLLFSLALLAWLGKGLDWAGLGQALQGARWGWIVLALLCYIATYWGRARRIVQILDPVKKLQAGRALSPLLIGFTVNNILPGRLGELVFAGLLARREKIPASSALAAVMVSRILDGIVILAFFGAGLAAFLAAERGGPDLNLAGAVFSRAALIANIRAAGFGGALLFGGLLAFLAAVGLWREGVLALLRRMLPARVLPLLERFVHGLEIMQSPGAFAAVLLLNFVPWGIELFSYYFAGQAFGLDLGLWHCSLLMGMTNLAMLLPSAPGGLGLFEGGGLMILALLGIATAPALAYLLTVHAIILLPVNLAGFYFLWREGLGIGDALAARAEGG